MDERRYRLDPKTGHVIERTALDISVVRLNLEKLHNLKGSEAVSFIDSLPVSMLHDMILEMVSDSILKKLTEVPVVVNCHSFDCNLHDLERAVDDKAPLVANGHRMSLI